MEMLRHIKRIILGTFALLIVSSGLFSVIPVSHVSAADNLDDHGDYLCVFPQQSEDSNNSGYHVPAGWLSIKILNRATMQVTFTPGTAKCANKAGNLVGSSISRLDGSTTTKPLIDGLFRDKDISKGSAKDDFAYRRESDSGDTNESVIDEFANSELKGGEHNLSIYPNKIKYEVFLVRVMAAREQR